MQRIAVGVDGSDGAHHALAWAIGEAALHAADVDVVHAWAPPVPISEIGVMLNPIDPGPYEDAARRVLDDAVGTVRETAATRSVALDARLVRGYPPTVLLSLLADAQLLVVGSRGRSALAGAVLGSVSEQCVHHATAPVAVVPPTASLPGPQDVVVGVDGSEGSRAALAWAMDEAAVRGARLCVVNAWWNQVPVSPVGAPVPPGGLHAEAEQLLQEMVDTTASQARRQDVELLAVADEASRALLDRTADAGLLVVGSRGRGGFAGLLLGSVSRRCLHHATCAVVVVPHSRGTLDPGPPPGSGAPS
jgi:nucleotide-binding universal stress UspA family protein